MKKIIFCIFLGSLVFLSQITHTFACSCLAPESPTKELNKSDKVFVWKVVEINKQKELVWDEFFITKDEIVFDVLANIKDSKNNQIILKTNGNSAACWYSFTQNEEYIVYAYGDDDNLSTSLCSRTTLLKNAVPDITELKVKFHENNDVNNDKKINSFHINMILLWLIVILTWSIILYKNKN